jgi:TonB family protein
MNLLETWVETPLAGALGWTLLHSLWEGAVISAALAAVLVALRSPRARYAAASVAMLLMLAAFGLTLVREMPEGAHGLRTVRAPAFPAWNVHIGTAASDPSHPDLAEVAPWLTPFWIAGVWIFYLKHVAGWISVSRLRRRGVCCASDEWQKQLTRLSARLRLTRPVRLLESCLVDAPMVLGHLRPVILMPIGLLAGLPAGQIEAILLHELAHIRRFDYLVNVLQKSVEGLLFYHPGVWWISRVMRDERENCCDDVAVRVSGNAHEYAVALAALEQKRWSGRELAVAATGGSLVKRIRRLLYPKGPNGAWTPLFAAVILMATAAVALTARPAAPPQQKSPGAQAQTERTETSPYMKWLNEDVVYIITDRERAAFLILTTDEERDHFIEQFWLVRSPTPGTPENEFKEEHYRRIAFANEHFAATNIPGWKTDRGRIYIPWGPPDEIDAHPEGGPGPVAPHEEWRYRYIEGVGNDVEFGFTDPLRNGEYRLTLNPLRGTRYYPQDQVAFVPGRVHVGARLQQPKLITKVDPIYPPDAMQVRMQGVVRLTIVIGKDGRVSDIRLVNGHPSLVAAAGDAVRQWVYEPTLLNGQPVEVVTEVDVNFLLAGK